MPVELLFEMTHRFKGDFPEVPLAEGVDYNALVADDIDAGEKPMFITLPIGEIGVKSGNGVTYDRGAIESLVEAVKADKPGGIKGHMREEERAYRFDLPSLRWVGSILEPNGLAWGKAYVPRYASDVREYINNCRATSAATATSIYGWAEKVGSTATKLIIESIDLADPARAGVKSTVSVPHITSEMTDGESDMTPPGEAPQVPATPPAPSNTGTTVSIQELSSQFTTQLQRVAELEGQVRIMEADAKVAQGVRTLISEYADAFTSMNINVSASGTDPMQVIREIADKLVAINANELKSRVDAVVAEMVNLPTAAKETDEGKALLGYVKDTLGTVKNEAEAKTRVTEIMQKPTYQTLAKSLIKELAGPNVVTTGTANNTAPKTSLLKVKEAALSRVSEIANKYGTNGIVPGTVTNK